MNEYYVNPFTLMNNQNPVPTNPFWSGVTAGENQAISAPFVNMARQSQGMDLQRKQQETNEFMSPAGQESRMSGLELMGKQNRASMEVLPYKTKEEIEKAKQEVRALPSATDEKIAKAEETARTLRGTPYATLLNTIGSAYPKLKDMPENARPLAYQGLMSQWEQTHPGLQVPQNLKEWKDGTLDDLAITHYAMLHSIGQQQKMEVEKEHTARAVDVANINARAHIGGIRAAQGNSPDRYFTELLRKVANGTATQGDLDNLPALVEDQFQKTSEGKAMTEAYKIAMFQAGEDGGKALNVAQQHIKAQRAAYWKSKGLEKYMPPDLKAQTSDAGKQTLRFDSQGNPVNR